jgi:hypothetical protein
MLNVKTRSRIASLTQKVMVALPFWSSLYGPFELFPPIAQSLMIVAMPHKPASKIAAVSTTTDSLEDVPDNISISFLPNHRSLMDRIIKRGLNYYLRGLFKK